MYAGRPLIELRWIQGDPDSGMQNNRSIRIDNRNAVLSLRSVFVNKRRNGDIKIAEITEILLTEASLSFP